MRSLFWKGKDAEPEAPAPAPSTDAPIPTLATGPLGSASTAPTGPGARGHKLWKGAPIMSPAAQSKLADLRKRVFGSAPTPYTQLLDQAKVLEEAGIADRTTQLRAAIKTTRIDRTTFLNAAASHKQALGSQREGFTRQLQQRQEQAVARRAQIQQEATSLDERLQALRAEYEGLERQQQEDVVVQQEFNSLVDALDAEISATMTQLESLYQE